MSWPVLDLELPLEKQLSLKIMEHQFQSLSREQAIDLLIKTNRQLAIQHQALKSTLGQALGFNNTK
jgi:Phycobilisome degradation protein nblA